MDAGPPDAGPPPPPLHALPFQVWVASGDAGWELPPSGDAGLPEGSRFRVVVELRLEALRVRLLDPSFKGVPAETSLSIRKQTQLDLKPDQPLISGSPYRLIIEPDGVPYLADKAGSALWPQSAAPQAAGEGHGAV